MDALPIASQAKSFVQWAAGDKEGAKQTQENFSRQCIGVSQVRSIVEVAKGDKEGAKRTQKEFLSVVNNTVNAVPILGHVKGSIHYIAGDKAGGHAAMKASSRTTGVMAGGAAGFLVAGPPGAIAGGIGAGMTMDGVITAAESARHKEFRPYGEFQIIKDPKNPGKWCDVIGGVAIDGVSGAGAGALVNNVKPVITHRLEYSVADGVPPPHWKAQTAIQTIDALTPDNMKDTVLATQSGDRLDKQSDKKLKKQKEKKKNALEGEEEEKEETDEGKEETFEEKEETAEAKEEKTKEESKEGDMINKLKNKIWKEKKKPEPQTQWHISPS